MANTTYNVLWRQATEHLVEQLDYEQPADPQLNPTDDESLLQHHAVLHVKYLQIFRKLEESYDQLVHPQKRRLLKDVLIAVVGRMLEVKQKLVNTEFSDFQSLDDVLIDLKLTPNDLEVPIPRFFAEEDSKRKEDWNGLMKIYNVKQCGYKEKPAEVELTLAEAVLCIQTNERGRQGRLRAKFMRDIRLQTERDKVTENTENEHDVSEAALNIQRVFRGFLARKRAKAESLEEQIFLGMASANRTGKNAPIGKAQANEARRKLIQKQYEDEYQQALISLKEKIMKSEGPDIREAMQDSFRQWYMDAKRETGKFPDFPEEEEWQKPDFKFGIVKSEIAAEGADANESQDEKGRNAKSAKSTKSGSSSAAAPEKKGGKGGKGNDKAAEEETQNRLELTQCVQDIKRLNESFVTTWLDKKDDKENFAQKHDPEIIKADKRKEVEAEIKLQIFTILRDELENLRLAVEKDGGKGKGKKGKADKKKKNKDKKDGKKGKKEKDLTANRTMESLVEELATSNLIALPQAVPIKSFLGDYNFMGSQLFEASGKKMYEHSLSEVRRIVSEYAILPLRMPLTSPFPFNRSLLIVGASESGKTMLLNAIANETGATLFNITPKVTAQVGQYQGKANVTRMMHTVFKVARDRKPAIVYIEDVEMVFAKKVPKEDTSDPKRIKKDLLKYIKLMEPEDRVMIIGLTNKPWEADVKAMAPAFEKIVYIPKPNYGARFNLIRDLMHARGAPSLPLPLMSVFAKLTEGFPVGYIVRMLDAVLTPRRIRMIPLKPLTLDEFVTQVQFLEPLDPETDALFKDWMEKAPLQRKRQAWIDAAAEAEAEKKAAPKGKKK